MKWRTIQWSARLLTCVALLGEAQGCNFERAEDAEAISPSATDAESNELPLSRKGEARPVLLFSESLNWTLGFERLRFREVDRFDIEDGTLVSQGNGARAISRSFSAQRHAGAIAIEWKARFGNGSKPSGNLTLALGDARDAPLYELVVGREADKVHRPGLALALYRNEDGERTLLASGRTQYDHGARGEWLHFRWVLAPNGAIKVSVGDAAARHVHALHAWDTMYDQWWNLQLVHRAEDDSEYAPLAIDDFKVTASRSRFLVIVARDLAEQPAVARAVRRYRIDAAAAGWDSSMLVVEPEDDPQQQVLELKRRIVAGYRRGASGFVIIGSHAAVPSVRWHYHPMEPFTEPSDLIYADVDTWVDIDRDGVYENFASMMGDDGSWLPDETRPANPDSPHYIPELFFSRIAPAAITTAPAQEADYVVRYLEKVAEYRRNGTRLTPEQDDRAFLLSEDEWQGKDLAHVLAPVAPNVHAMFNRGVTTAASYARALEDGYRFVTAIVHSDEEGHYFTGWDGSRQTTDYFSISWLRTLVPKVSQLNLIACGSCNFTTRNIGAVGLFENDYVLNVLGSTGLWGIGPDIVYYQDLASGEAVGPALRDLARRNTHDVGWPKGILLGDPLVLYTKEVPNKAPVLATSLYKVQAHVGETLELPFDTEDPEGDVVEVTLGDLPAGASFDGETLRFSPTPEQMGMSFETFVKLTEPGRANEYRESFVIEVPLGPGQGTLDYGDFEKALDGRPLGWGTEAWDSAGVTFTWGEQLGVDGSAGVAISSASPNDAWWGRPVSGLEPGTRYTLSGWLKGGGISGEQSDASVSIGVLETSDHVGQGGTFDWTRFELTFVPPESGNVTVICRLGYFGNLTTGTGYCDQLSLERAPSE